MPLDSHTTVYPPHCVLSIGSLIEFHLLATNLYLDKIEFCFLISILSKNFE